MTADRLEPTEEIAAVAAAVQLLLAARSQVVEPLRDPTAWRFQNRWWLRGSLRARPRP